MGHASWAASKYVSSSVPETQFLKKRGSFIGEPVTILLACLNHF